MILRRIWASSVTLSTNTPQLGHWRFSGNVTRCLHDGQPNRPSNAPSVLIWIDSTGVTSTIRPAFVNCSLAASARARGTPAPILACGTLRSALIRLSTRSARMPAGPSAMRSISSSFAPVGTFTTTSKSASLDSSMVAGSAMGRSVDCFLAVYQQVSEGNSTLAPLLRFRPSPCAPSTAPAPSSHSRCMPCAPDDDAVTTAVSSQPCQSAGALPAPACRGQQPARCHQQGHDGWCHALLERAHGAAGRGCGAPTGQPNR
jgi:hypothetical protein